MSYTIATLSRNQKSYDLVLVLSRVKVCMTTHFGVRFDLVERLSLGLLFLEGTFQVPIIRTSHTFCPSSLPLH